MEKYSLIDLYFFLNFDSWWLVHFGFGWHHLAAGAQWGKFLFYIFFYYFYFFIKLLFIYLFILCIFIFIYIRLLLCLLDLCLFRITAFWILWYRFLWNYSKLRRRIFKISIKNNWFKINYNNNNNIKLLHLLILTMKME